MEKENITDNLEKLLMAIHRQVVAIRDADHQIPKIEMDKTLSNIRALYEQFTVLNYLNTHPPVKEHKVVQPEVVENKAIVESPFVPIIEPKEEPTPAPSVSTIQEAAPKIIEPEFQRQVEPDIIKQPDVAPVKPVIQTQLHDEKYMPKTETKVESPPAPSSVIKETPKSISSEPQRLGDKLRFQKLEDLHKAVTISDKFLYMNELFEAENNSYKEAMDMLNRLTSESEAEHYMDSLSARYRWSQHPKTEKKFRELVSRKFV